MYKILLHIHLYVCVYVDTYIYCILDIGPCHHGNTSKAKSGRARERMPIQRAEQSPGPAFPEEEDLPLTAWEGVVGSEPTKD